jgi:DNA-binding MarR family transcriptional regulator
MLPSPPKFLIATKTLTQFLRDFPDGVLAVGVQLLKGMRILAQRMNDASSARLSPHGLSSIQFNYLAVLYARRHDGISAGELATSVGTTTGAVTTMVDVLESERLVARHQHPTDGRSVVLKLSAKGKKVYIQSSKTYYTYVGVLVANLGKDNAQKLLDLLVELEDALQATTSEHLRATTTGRRKRSS